MSKNKMTSDLAVKILNWETEQRKLNILKDEIEEEVLAIGTTQTIGNVRVTYSKPSRTFLYQAAVEALDEYDTTPYEKPVVVDYTKMAKDMGLDVDFVYKGSAKTTLKLL